MGVDDQTKARLQKGLLGPSLMAPLFGARQSDVKVGTVLRIRLPKDYVVDDRLSVALVDGRAASPEPKTVALYRYEAAVDDLVEVDQAWVDLAQHRMRDMHRQLDEARQRIAALELQLRRDADGSETKPQKASMDFDALFNRTFPKF